MASSTSSRPRSARTDGAVGMRDIADDLGISISLVSKVLNQRMGTSGVSAGMVEAIRNKATELNYRKNRQAEALRSGRQNVIGVCVHHHGEPGSMIVEAMVEGIAASASRNAQRMMLHFYRSAADFRSFRTGLTRNAVDGVIMGGLPHAELISDLRELHLSGLPIVTIHDEVLDPSFPNAGMNQHEIGRMATQHLIERGCRRIAHFRVLGDTIPQMRYEGYLATLKQNGLTVSPELIYPVVDFTHAQGLVAIENLLKQKVKFDGLYCQSDHQACAAINTLVMRGYQVPGQIKVIGVDNSAFGQFGIVPLTSVSQEFHLRGELAFDLMRKLLEGQRVESIRINPVIHARASTSTGASAPVQI